MAGLGRDATGDPLRNFLPKAECLMFAYCLDCTTAFAVDLQFCPHCGSRRKSYTRPEPLAPTKSAAKKTTPMKDGRVVSDEGDPNV